MSAKSLAADAPMSAFVEVALATLRHEQPEAYARLVAALGGLTLALQVGDLRLDVARREIAWRGAPFELTAIQFDLLRVLMANPGRVFSRDELLNQVWGYDYFGGERTVDVHIRRLRAKIEDDKHSFIETIRSMGYRFKEES